MEDRPLNEFNLLATPPQDLLLRLETLFFNGGSVTSIFGNTSSQTRHAKMKEAERERARDVERMFVEIALAEPERVAAFGERLQQLDKASMAALLENEKKLREAEEQLADVRERAFSLTMPDGGNTKVYRDGGAVAEEDGTRVDFMQADDLPAETPELSEVKGAFGNLSALKADRKTILDYRAHYIDPAKERLAQGNMTQGELDEYEAGIKNPPASIVAHLLSHSGAGEGADLAADQESAGSGQVSSAFGAAASEIAADDFAALPEPEPPVNSPLPAASMHGPK